jgi:hypothetical protein
MVNAVSLAEFCSEQKPGVDDCKMGGENSLPSAAPSVRTILSTCIVHQNATREAGKFKIKEADVAMTCKQNLATTTVAATTASATVPETKATTAAPVKTTAAPAVTKLLTLQQLQQLQAQKSDTVAAKTAEVTAKEQTATTAKTAYDSKCKADGTVAGCDTLKATFETAMKEQVAAEVAQKIAVSEAEVVAAAIAVENAKIVTTTTKSSAPVLSSNVASVLSITMLCAMSMW